MDIEVSRSAVSLLPVTAQLLTSLRNSARLASTHYSTQIEGNRLTEADISPWVEYFCEGMADSFANVRIQAEKLKTRPDQSKLLRELDTRQKRILDAFRESRFLTTKEVSAHLGVSSRTALNLCNSWSDSGILLKSGEGKSRRYELASQWLELI